MKISIITPCFNEELNIERCITETAEVMKTLEIEYEHIFCDNASTDKTVSIIKAFAAKDTRIKLIINSRNSRT